jgi:hypothetical protein
VRGRGKPSCTDSQSCGGLDRTCTPPAACTRLSIIRSFYVDAPDASARLNEIGLQLSPASMNFGCTALNIIIELSAEIRAAGEGVHNQPVSEEQLERVFLLQATWFKMMDAHSVKSIQHPKLGRLPILQPLLHTLVAWRGAGMGNGDGSKPDGVFELVLAKGARVDIPNSLGMSLLHAMIEANCKAGDGYEETAATESDAYSRDKVMQNLELARILLARGAPVHERTLPWADTGDIGERDNYGDLDPLLLAGRRYNAAEACHWMRARKPLRSLELLSQIYDDVARTQLPPAPEPDLIKGPDSPGFVDRAYHPLARADLPSATWVQAIFNTAWLVSRLTALESAHERRGLLTEISAHAPFRMPLMTVVPWRTMRRLGKIPRRDTSRPGGEWTGPVPVSLLPPGARVVFLSHRWLRPTHPDDEAGTKFQMLDAVMAVLARELGTGADSLYVWCDYSCIDQSDPFSGVQMLPAIMACCEEIAYVTHPEYFLRAWCRTELFFHWRLQCHARKWRLLEGGHVREEPRERPEGDPATGELYSEADRVALVNMTSIFDNR